MQCFLYINNYYKATLYLPSFWIWGVNDCSHIKNLENFSYHWGKKWRSETVGMLHYVDMLVLCIFTKQQPKFSLVCELLIGLCTVKRVSVLQVYLCILEVINHKRKKRKWSLKTMSVFNISISVFRHTIIIHYLLPSSSSTILFTLGLW